MLASRLATPLHLEMGNIKVSLAEAERVKKKNEGKTSQMGQNVGMISNKKV